MLLNVDLEIERENAAERIEELGVGSELVRGVELEEFDLHVSAFRAHASLADLVVLNRAFRRREESGGADGGATFVDAMLAVLGIEIR
jgi:hypothetical protein